MQNVSEKYKQYMQRKSIVSMWYGTITFENSSSINFTGANIDQNKSKITRQCVSGENLEIGNVFAAELRLTLRDSSTWKISDKSYNFYDAEVTMWFRLFYDDDTHEDVYCGKYTITEAERTYHTVTLTAYDSANHFNKKLEGRLTGNYTPYDALATVCALCNVTFGMSRNQVMQLPNGDLGDLKMSVYKLGASYKDIVGNICAILGSNALCDRLGRLILVQYEQTGVRAIDAGQRYNSSYVDYQGHYTTICELNDKGEVIEYHTSDYSQGLRELTMNIGKNILLNKYPEEIRNSIMDYVLQYIKNIVYSPCNVTMPIDPSIDVADMVSLIGGEIAGTYVLTLDTTVVSGKTYYRKNGNTYVEVTPTSSDNPSAEGWYEVGTNLICTKIEMPLYGQMKIISEAGSYDIDVDYYATSREQDEQEKEQENQEKWDEQDDINSDVDDYITNINNDISNINNSITNIDAEISNLAIKIAINYIFPYYIFSGSIADGSEEYVLRFRFKCDRAGDTVAFYSMVTFLVSTTFSHNTYHDCTVTVKYYLDDTLTVTCAHTYADGNAILTLNGCMTDPGAGNHTFDVKFALSGGSIE